LKLLIPKELIAKDIIYHINPTGRFVIGGPQGDAGLTGRKIIVDTYGVAVLMEVEHLVAKIPTKVDRSAAYAARYVAKKSCKQLELVIKVTIQIA